jgi:integrase
VREFASKLAPAIKEYLEFRKTLGYATERHESYLAMLDAYYNTHHPELGTLTKESVRGWLNYEASRGRGFADGYFSSVRRLAQYMGNGAYIVPTTAKPKKPKYIPYMLTDDELSRLFAVIDNIKGQTDRFIKLMAPTIFRLMFTCGLRPQEARLVKRDNINLTTGEILIEKTKENKERIVVMSDDMLEQCRKYDIVRAVANLKSEYFFARADNTPMPSHQLRHLFRRCWQQANPDVPANMLPKIRPYDLRHRFASTILQKWINEERDFYAMLPYLRAYMGHEKFSHTAYYIHLLPENLLCSSGIDWSAIDSVNPEVIVWKG